MTWENSTGIRFSSATWEMTEPSAATMVDRRARLGIWRLPEGWSCWLNSFTALPMPPTAGNRPAATKPAAARITNGISTPRSLPAETLLAGGPRHTCGV